METTETINFENGHALHELLTADPQHLEILQKTFAVKIITRDGWLKIQGTPQNTALVRQVIQELQTAKNLGMTIRRHEFIHAIENTRQALNIPLASLQENKIHTSAKRPPVVAKTLNQKLYLDAISRHDLVFGLGPAGTGKTFLAVACALTALKSESVKRIILTRPAVEAGEALGFLPGDLREKILPYLRPLYDAINILLDPEEIAKANERQTIEIAPLAYMRGRTLSHAFVILDEAQNTTPEQMFMLLTRLGPGSKCVVTGDPSQCDLPRSRPSGLQEAILALKGIPEIPFIYFQETDVIRHELVQKIIVAYRNHRQRNDSAQTTPS
ncbi:MAG: PhoH family protein [Methylacidiphilales bacterium]|nr:PhoH family protein [Candidatus Methylacidiphilales bacterium]MDW8349068.1 PhoH family protein [Verrucomicrobiae bacterium]